MGRHVSFFKFVLILAVAVLLAATTVRADVTGSILGVIRDKTQAVVGGARVVATNVDTNFSKEATTAADGTYTILALPAGTYKLTVTGAGFRQSVASGIEVKVNDQLQIDITLQVGSVQQEISVIANAVQVETENTQLGDVIDSKKMLALPLNGRSYIDLLGLQAGVAPSGGQTIGGDRQVSGDLNAGNISVNGQRETANAFLVNGGDVSEGRNLGAGLIPNLDSIEEFRLITNSFDAEYGKFSGAVMNAITKSGTNGIHGDVFEFVRNDKFDAKNFFDQSKGELRRNQFGYAVGGPFRKNKLFWFTDYQGTRQTVGASTGVVTLPTSDQRNGNFGTGAFVDSNSGHAMVVQRAPCPTGATCGPNWAQILSQRLGKTVTAGEPYAAIEVPAPTPTDPNAFTIQSCNDPAQSVFPGGVIPQSAFAAPATKLLPYIPLPNLDPVLGTFTDNGQKNTATDNKAGQRVDFINQKTGNWSFYYHFDDSTVVNSLNASVPGFASLTPSRAQQIVISNNKMVGSTGVNQVRVSFFRTATVTDKPKSSFAKLSDLGFVTGVGTLGINPSGPPGFPETVPPEYFNNFSIGVNTLTTFQPNNTWHVSEGFSKIRGPHTLKFGGEFRYLQINERNTCAPNGDFTFDGTETGNDIADFLLGASVGYNQCSQQFLDSRTRYGGAYAEDTWKVKSNITLNLGVRWEVSMPWYDTQGKIETIVPGLQSTQFPTAPTGLVFPGDPGIPKTLVPTKYDNFGPRLGLAYSPGFSDGILGKVFGGPGKTSIRAAYGLYYTSVEDLNLFYEVADAPFGLYWTSPVSVMFDEPFRIRANGQSLGQRFPFIAPVPGAPSNKTLDFSVYEPFNYFPGYDTHNKLPYAEHFNLSIQRELSKSTVLTVAYVGTEGHRLITQREANPGSAALCQQLAATPGVTDITAGTPGCGPGNENDVFQRPDGSFVYSTRQQLLNPNFCPGSALQVCYGSNNTNTL